MGFTQDREVNKEEQEKMYQELGSVAELLYAKYGPEGIGELINILTNVMYEDISDACNAPVV